MPLKQHDPTLWCNVPGAIAAYQPVGAPDSLSARHNCANDGRTGQYTLTLGVAPPDHDPRRGWVLDGTRYLDTGYDDAVDVTVLIRFANAANSGGGRALCGSDDQDGGVLMAHYWWGNTAVFAAAMRKYYTPASSVSAGVWCIAGGKVYFDGLLSGTMATGNYNVARTLLIGATRRHSDGAIVYNSSVDIQALLICASTLSPSHVRNCSHQMAYCHVNQDWSVWGRRRRYYYAPLIIVETGSARAAIGGAFGAPAYASAPHAGHNAAMRPGVAVAGASGTIRSTAAAGGHTAIVQRPTAPGSGNQGKRND